MKERIDAVKNEYINIDELTVGIKCISHKYGEKIFFIDREDLPRVKMFKWRVTGIGKRNKCHYGACRPWRKKDLPHWTLLMHRLITSFPEGCEIDHINQNGLDNRKCNLRLVTKEMNSYNKTYAKKSKTGYKGVYLKNGKYEVQIRKDGIIKGYGTFKTAKEAAIKYNEIVKLQRGKDAILNIIDE